MNRFREVNLAAEQLADSYRLHWQEGTEPENHKEDMVTLANLIAALALACEVHYTLISGKLQ